MAQLDRLLAQITLRGAASLRLVPDQQPMLESAAGTQTPLLPTPVPPTLLEHLVNEILPMEQEEALARTAQASFTYGVGGQNFRIAVSRGSQGLTLVAEPEGGAAPAPSRVPDPIAAPPAMPTHPLAETPLPRPTAIATAPSGANPMAERLLKALLDHSASDLHCTTWEVPLVRIHGDLGELDGFAPLGPKELIDIMKSLAPPMAWEHYEAKNDADFAYSYEAGGCRLRVNYFADRVGPGFVCRVIPNQIPDPDKLGLADPIKRLADLAKGLVLVTGPTGSGKSTTLAAIIDIANRKRTDHILTIEDPIEFVHPRKKCLVNQREVGTHTASFKSGLRAALREDPDIVLVGEMRDLETIAIALETAVTGHLVFGTLHTNSAVGTMDRIVDQFPADRQQQIRVMLADSCKAVISQILLKKIGGGRIAAIESLFITPAISNLIREGKNFQIPSAMQTGRAYGQKLMNDAIVELVHGNLVEPMEAYMKCPDKETLMASFKRAGINWDPRGDEKPMPL